MRVTLVALAGPTRTYRVEVGGDALGLIDQRDYGWHALSIMGSHASATNRATAIALLWADRIRDRKERALREVGLNVTQSEAEAERWARDAYRTALTAEVVETT